MTNPEPRPKSVIPILALGLVSIMVSPILVRFAGEAPGVAVAVWRTVFAALLLTPVAVMRIGPEVKQFSRREWVLVLGAGVVLGLHFIAWIESLYHTTVASASVLVWTNPLFLAVLGFFFLRERLTRSVVIALMVGVFGAGLLGWGDLTSPLDQAANPMLGNSLALVAAVLVSIYLLIGRVVRQRYSWLAYVFPLYVTVALTTLGMAWGTGIPLLGYPLAVYGWCALLALGPSLLGHGSFNYVVRYIPVALLGIISLLEPVGASILAYFLFDEVPGLLALAGMLLVLVGVGTALRPTQNAG